jgi:hypothetical protein
MKTIFKKIFFYTILFSTSLVLSIDSNHARLLIKSSVGLAGLYAASSIAYTYRCFRKDAKNFSNAIKNKSCQYSSSIDEMTSDLARLIYSNKLYKVIHRLDTTQKNFLLLLYNIEKKITEKHLL